MQEIQKANRISSQKEKEGSKTHLTEGSADDLQNVNPNTQIAEDAYGKRKDGQRGRPFNNRGARGSGGARGQYMGQRGGNRGFNRGGGPARNHYKYHERGDGAERPYDDDRADLTENVRDLREDDTFHKPRGRGGYSRGTRGGYPKGQEGGHQVRIHHRGGQRGGARGYAQRGPGRGGYRERNDDAEYAHLNENVRPYEQEDDVGSDTSEAVELTEEELALMNQKVQEFKEMLKDVVSVRSISLFSSTCLG